MPIVTGQTEAEMQTLLPDQLAAHIRDVERIDRETEAHASLPDTGLPAPVAIEANAAFEGERRERAEESQLGPEPNAAIIQAAQQDDAAVQERSLPIAIDRPPDEPLDHNGHQRESDRGCGQEAITTATDMAEGKNRTTSIKGSFKAATKCITECEDDAPQPSTRRRTGEKEGGLIIKRLPAPAAGRPAARGRYASLQTGAAAPKSAPGWQQEQAGLYLSDTLDWLNLWQDNAEAPAESFDDNCPDRHTYASLDL